MAVRTIYFEDLAENVAFWSEAFVVDADEMLDYGVRNDPWPCHADAEAAKASPYGAIIASGGFIVTLMNGRRTASTTIALKLGRSWADLSGR